MPVTIHAAPFPTRKWKGKIVSSAEELLRAANPCNWEICKRVVQSSFIFGPDVPPIAPLENGLVHAAIQAYSCHHHLTLRPEDIWFAILTQLSLHINAHAEELRSFFVSHQGQEELIIRYYGGNLLDANMGDFANEMGALLAKQVNDPELYPWIMPDFSTTTDTDRVVASVIMMGALQKYYSYGMTGCALPSVTLLGERADWELLLQRIEKLPQLGEEPTQFHSLLKPVLRRFVQSFDSPDSAEICDFWQKIADYEAGSGRTYVSGWISAFCFWDQEGKSLHNASGLRDTGYQLDGIMYHKVDFKKVPSGCTSVPVALIDGDVIHHTVMVAGSVGARISSSGNAVDESSQWHFGWSRGNYWDEDEEIYEYSDKEEDEEENEPTEYEVRTPTGEPALDSLQPETGWWMYETREAPTPIPSAQSIQVPDTNSVANPIVPAADTIPAPQWKPAQNQAQDVAT